MSEHPPELFVLVKNIRRQGIPPCRVAEILGIELHVVMDVLNILRRESRALSRAKIIAYHKGKRFRTMSAEDIASLYQGRRYDGKGKPV